MNPSHVYKLFRVFALLLGLTPNVTRAQDAILSIENIRTDALPLITFKCALFRNGIPATNPASAVFTLTENGRTVEPDILCPGTSNNYVALVLDNSGSMTGEAFRAVKDACGGLLDSLLPGDKAALYDFNGNGRMLQDFTNDKALLHSVLQAMTTGATTPLYSATFLALRRLAEMPGRKYCVVFTDGSDTGPGIPTPESIIQYAVENHIIVFTIGYGSGGINEFFLRTLASQTGGVYSYNDDYNRLNSILNAIAMEIISPYCTVRCTTTTCEDSIRVLDMNAQYDGSSASTSETVRTPWRPDTINLHVESPHVISGEDAITVYVRLSPGLHRDLILSYSFLVRFLPGMLALGNNGKAIAAYTLSNGGTVSIDSLRPGVFRMSAEGIRIRDNVANLAGFKLLVPVQDSSRPSRIVLDSVSLSAGCPNYVLSYPDTVYICNCEQTMAVEVQEALVAASEEVRVPVMLTGTPLVEKSLFTLHLNYDSDYLEPIGVDGIGAITENALLQWRIKNGDTLEVRADEQFDPAPGNVLFYVRFKVKYPKSATVSALSIPYMRAFSDCCYHQATPGPNAILIDGLCDKVVRRRADFTLEPNSPNPARGETSFRFTVHEQERFSEAQATLTLYRSDGTVVSELYNNSVRPGEYAVPYNLAALPVGTYYYTLSISGRVQTRSMVVVR